jgi:hypothetical protein
VREEFRRAEGRDVQRAVEVRRTVTAAELAVPAG